MAIGFHDPEVAATVRSRGYQRYTVFLLAAVLSLDAADRAMVSTIAPTLKKAFSLNNTKIGLLAAAFSIVGSLATLPVGILTDRVRRTRLLGLSIAIWSGTMAVAGAARNYAMLFASRMFLGVAGATDGPTIASLTGDLYPVERRGSIFGKIATGQLVGTLISFGLAGYIADTFGWRWAFWIFALPGGWLTLSVLRLAEPPRGLQERLAAGQQPEVQDTNGKPEASRTLAYAAIAERQIQPYPELVLNGDQSGMATRDVVRYLLKIRTNTIVIIANSVGNFFLAGISTFAVVYFAGQFHMSNAKAGATTSVLAIGAVLGFLIGGYLGDRLMQRGMLNGRIVVGSWAFILSAVFLWPAFQSRSLLPVIPLFLLGGAGITAHGPPLDAVRLDIVHPQLWGRAESFRTLVRIGAEAAAPALFGFLADHIAGGGHRGLQLTILITLPTLALNGVLTLLAMRYYPREVASVLASRQDAPPASTAPAPAV